VLFILKGEATMANYELIAVITLSIFMLVEIFFVSILFYYLNPFN